MHGQKWINSFSYFLPSSVNFWITDSSIPNSQISDISLVKSQHCDLNLLNNWINQTHDGSPSEAVPQNPAFFQVEMK